MVGALLLAGCAAQKEVEPKKLVPKDMNGTTTSTTTSEGTVYAKDKGYYASSCQSGNGQGCRDLSTLYELGLGVPKNIQKALQLNEKGCSLGNGSACSRAGNYYDDGRAGIKNKEKSASYYMEGCKLNYGIACNNIGSRYTNGTGVVKNAGLAETYLKKSISLGNNAYSNLGFLYESMGDTEKAKTNYKKACDLKDPLGCSNLANVLKNEKQYTPAYNYYLNACNLSKSGACNSASMMIYKKLLTPPNPNQTMFRLDSNSCEMNNKTGCSNLAYNYEKGVGTVIDNKKAQKYYKKSCKLGDKSSCKKLK